MNGHKRRLDRLEAHYQPNGEHPARIPDWIRPWLDPLSIEDLEVLEAGWQHIAAVGDVITLPPELRERYEALMDSWNTFQEERR